jgi:hypothetical protein
MLYKLTVSEALQGKPIHTCEYISRIRRFERLKYLSLAFLSISAAHLLFVTDTIYKQTNRKKYLQNFFITDKNNRNRSSIFLQWHGSQIKLRINICRPLSMIFRKSIKYFINSQISYKTIN